MSAAKDIRISSLLKSKFIDLNFRETDKSKVLAGLVELLAVSKKLVNTKAFLKAMQEREKLGSTGIGMGVAIPHAKSDAARDFVLVFARSDEGIDFGALDGEKTYLFFSLASPKDEVGGHLKILSEISHLVKDKFVVDLLKKAKDAEAVLKIISRMEGRSSH